MDRVARSKGRKWKVTGRVWKAGKCVDELSRLVDASAEEELDAVQKQVKAELFDRAVERHGRSNLRDIRIEVDQELEP
jgi:hypothetical protein